MTLFYITFKNILDKVPNIELAILLYQQFWKTTVLQIGIECSTT